MTASITPRRVHGGAHQRVSSPHTGHDLRVVRQAPGDVDRTVYLPTPDGYVELGSVTLMGAGRFYALPPVGVEGGWGCDSYAEGARILDAYIDAAPVTTYIVGRRPEGAAEALLVSGPAVTIPTDQEV